MRDELEYKIEIIYHGTETIDIPGGQHAGSPASDVRVTHIPTNTMAQYGVHGSQHLNKLVCMEMIDWGLIRCGWTK